MFSIGWVTKHARRFNHLEDFIILSRQRQVKFLYIFIVLNLNVKSLEKYSYPT
jgi:hypothetical protein